MPGNSGCTGHATVETNRAPRRASASPPALVGRGRERGGEGTSSSPHTDPGLNLPEEGAYCFIALLLHSAGVQDIHFLVLYRGIPSKPSHIKTIIIKIINARH